MRGVTDIKLWLSVKERRESITTSIKDHLIEFQVSDLQVKFEFNKLVESCCNSVCQFLRSCFEIKQICSEIEGEKESRSNFLMSSQKFRTAFLRATLHF